MFSSLKNWLVVGCLVVSIGTPWGVLQTVAWCGMVVRYSQQTTFVRAVAMTFDGKHPCRLCHFVKEGQSTDRQKDQNSMRAEQKLQLGLAPEGSRLIHPPTQALLVTMSLPWDALNEPPPTPPPRPA